VHHLKKIPNFSPQGPRENVPGLRCASRRACYKMIRTMYKKYAYRLHFSYIVTFCCSISSID